MHKPWEELESALAQESTSTSPEITATPKSESSNTSIKDYVPLMEALVWPLFWLIILLIVRKQLLPTLLSTIETIRDRIRTGANFKAGNFEIGNKPIVTSTPEAEKVYDHFDTKGDASKLKTLFKAQGKSTEGWFFIKSTKAMLVPNGCIIQVTSEKQNPDGSWNVAEAVTFVPGNLVIKQDDQGGHFIESVDSK